jgi:hypothetical protein
VGVVLASALSRGLPAVAGTPAHDDVMDVASEGVLAT